MHDKMRKFIAEGLNLYTTKRIKEITFVNGLQNLYNLMPNDGDKFFVESLYTTTLPKNILRQLKGFDKKEDSYNYTYNEKLQNYQTFNSQYGIVLPGLGELMQLKQGKDEIIEGTTVEEVNTNSTNTDGQKLDTAKFVTWQQFSDRVSPIEHSINRLKNNQEAIQAWGIEVDQQLEALKQAKPTIIEIKPAPELPTFSMGIQHKSFEDLWAMVNSRLPSGFPVIPWVYGPAGTGKSYACESIAKAMAKVLGREFNCYAVGTTLAKFETLGFVNTSGYQSTPFRLAYEYGHLFCADEMDSWAKEATVALNNALANGECAFPDKIVKRHPNFIMVACANTIGAGATMDYAGRNKQDSATLDRFQYLHWELDEALEDNLTANKDWLKYVRHVRARANASGINPKPMITPRASMAGTALLAGGLNWDKVVNMCLRKGLSEPQWAQIK